MQSVLPNGNRWPKTPIPLTPEQEVVRERWVRIWHEQLPSKYSFIEAFNQGFPAHLPIERGWRTLEVGSGIGAHLPFEKLTEQEYHVLELREEFCSILRAKLPAMQVHQGNIEERQSFAENACFDRIIAIHVLEHLRNLPAAVEEVARLLKPTGVFDVVLPTEGTFAYAFARKISAERLFKRTFKMDYTPIICNEHVSTLAEIKTILFDRFRAVSSAHFPLRVPIDAVNLCVGYRCRLK